MERRVIREVQQSKEGFVYWMPVDTGMTAHWHSIKRRKTGTGQPQAVVPAEPAPACSKLGAGTQSIELPAGTLKYSRMVTAKTIKITDK